MGMATHRTVFTILIGLATWIALPVAGLRARPATPAVQGTSETFMLFWKQLDPSARGEDTRFRAPIYEAVTVRARDVGVDGMTVAVSGYGQAELTSAYVEDRASGDLHYGYVRWHDPSGMLRLTAGRQFVYRGAGMGAGIDGVMAEGYLPADIQAQAFGGLATQRGFEGDLQRPVVGARVAYAPWDVGSAGLAFFQQWNDGQTDRQNLGADFSLRAFDPLEVDGTAVLDTVGARVQDMNLRFTGKIGRKVQVFVDYGMFDPDALLPRTSIFWVFSRQTHHELGGGVSVTALPGLRFWTTYDHYLLDGDTGYNARARVSYTLPATSPLTVGAEYGRLSEPSNGYDSVRAFVQGETGFGLRYSAEGMAYFFSESIQGQDETVTTWLGTGYRFLPGLVLDGGVEWNRTPRLESELIGFAKLTWTFAR